ncbi:MAG: cytochrome c oxidase assembly protein [Verrucomicrobiales bacterium]|nr:cytochrome c oxidase assembly protein [Verrucomicrobiales bacterium]
MKPTTTPQLAGRGYPQGSKLALVVAGLIVLTATWTVPHGLLHNHGFSIHMTLHMLLVAVAAPLLSLGLAATAMDPVRRFPRLFSPIPASAVEFLAVWAWHTPGLHHLARHSSALWIVEQSSFLITGLWLWLAAFGGDATRRATRSAEGIIGLLLTSMHMTLLGALVALTPRPLYASPHPEAGAPLADQQLGGVIMLLIGGIAYLVGALWLTRQLLHSKTSSCPGGL